MATWRTPFVEHVRTKLDVSHNETLIMYTSSERHRVKGNLINLYSDLYGDFCVT